MWHASGCGRNDLESQLIALSALDGVGSIVLGEWRERGGRGIYHVRRRLTDAERGPLVVRDIRGTAEEAQRMETLFAELPPHTRAMMPARPTAVQPGAGPPNAAQPTVPRLLEPKP